MAYQGLPGAYNEVAARKACPDFDPLPCEQSEVAFQVWVLRIAKGEEGRLPLALSQMPREVRLWPNNFAYRPPDLGVAANSLTVCQTCAGFEPCARN